MILFLYYFYYEMMHAYFNISNNTEVYKLMLISSFLLILSFLYANHINVYVDT